MVPSGQAHPDTQCWVLEEQNGFESWQVGKQAIPVLPLGRFEQSTYFSGLVQVSASCFTSQVITPLEQELKDASMCQKDAFLTTVMAANLGKAFKHLLSSFALAFCIWPSSLYIGIS